MAAIKHLLATLSAALLLNATATAQDQYFTQFAASPLSVNPAMTGLMVQDYRITAIYGTQLAPNGSIPYISGALSYDMPILKGKLPEGDAIGVGILAYNCNSNSGWVRQRSAGVSVAYHKGFGKDKKQHLSFGLQGTLAQTKVDIPENDPYPFLPIRTGSASVSCPDYNAGIMYTGQLSSAVTAYGGFSISHFTQPEETIFENDHKIYKRHNVSLGAAFELNKRTVLYTSALYQEQAGATDIRVGAIASYMLHAGQGTQGRNATLLYLGGWYSYDNVVSPYASAERGKIRLGISYNVNASSLPVQYSNKGICEIAISYLGSSRSGKGQKKQWNVPKIF